MYHQSMKNTEARVEHVTPAASSHLLENKCIREIMGGSTLLCNLIRQSLLLAEECFVPPTHYSVCQGLTFALALTLFGSPGGLCIFRPLDL